MCPTLRLCSHTDLPTTNLSPPAIVWRHFSHLLCLRAEVQPRLWILLAGILYVTIKKISLDMIFMQNNLKKMRTLIRTLIRTCVSHWLVQAPQVWKHESLHEWAQESGSLTRPLYRLACAGTRLYPAGLSWVGKQSGSKTAAGTGGREACGIPSGCCGDSFNLSIPHCPQQLLRRRGLRCHGLRPIRAD